MMLGVSDICIVFWYCTISCFRGSLAVDASSMLLGMSNQGKRSSTCLGRYTIAAYTLNMYSYVNFMRQLHNNSLTYIRYVFFVVI